MIDVVESAAKQIVELGLGVILFDGVFQEAAKVGGEQGAVVVLADVGAAVLGGDFAEGMQVATAGWRPVDLGREKEVELAGKGALWAARAFGDGFD